MDGQQVSQSLRIIIIGGSIAGLFTGVVLSNLSRVESITILERSQEHQQKDQGAGIRLSDEVISSITKYTGLKPEDYNIATQCFKLMTATGDVAMQRDVLMWCTSWGQIYQALKKKFVEAGQGKTQYRHGCTLQSLFDTVDTVDVHFTNENGQPETAEADLVIGADGISSTTRQLLAPETQRMYAGYTIVRGVISASVLSPDVLAMHDKASVFAFNYNSQFISYWVPSSDGPVSESNRYFNWGWYTSYSEAELEDVMTDSAGSRRAFTVPQGALKAEVADKIRARAGVELPRALAEPVERTKEPFVQVITDSTAPPNVFFSGKVVLIGDAVAGQRPHTGSACTQCTFHTLLLESYLQGDITLDNMGQQAREFSKLLVTGGRELGVYTQSTELTPPEKAQKYMAAWLPIQADLSTKYNNYVNSAGAKI